MAKKKQAPAATNQTTAVLAQGRASQTALRERGEALVAEAVGLKARIARDFWELGRRLMAMRDEGIHTALGYDRLDALFADRIGIAPTMAFKLIVVAEQLPRVEAVKLGQEKAYALVALARATPGVDSAAELAASDVEVAGKPLSQASLRELQAAVAAARPKRPRTLAERGRANAERRLIKGLHERLDALGLPRREIACEGDAVILRLTRRQVQRLIAG